MATTATDVLESFHSSFMDKKEIPRDLELMWLEKSIGRYSVEIAPLVYDNETEDFDVDLDRYIIDLLATNIKLFYMQREYSRVNKIASVVGKDLSINGSNGLQKYTHAELDKVQQDLSAMYDDLKPTAYN